MSLTLEELKRKNAEADGVTVETEEVDETVEEVTEEVEAEEEQQEGSDEQDVEDSDNDAWMTADEESDDDDRSVPLGKHISIRTKLKSQVKDQKSEIETLRAEIEELKKAPSKQVDAPATLQPPKAQDFQDEYGDTDWEKFNSANAKYMQDLVESRLTGSSKKQEEEAKKVKAQQEREQSVDHHYELAGKLVQKGVLKAEDYAEADGNIVNTLEQSVPGQGRAVADGLIQHLAEVSDQPEKVWFKLGKDKSLLNQVIQAYQDDPSGVKGVAALARISQKYVTPNKRKSSAPKPPSKVQGDAIPSGDAAKLQRKYNEAHKKHKTADAFRIKRGAKKAGVDVSKW